MNSFLTSYLPWIKVAAAASASALIFAYGYHEGAEGVQAEWDQEQLAQSRVVAQDFITRANEDFSLGTLLEKNLEESRDFTFEIQARIQSALGPSITCPVLPDPWGVLHDAAATGKLPANLASGEPDGATSTPAADR